MCGFLNSHGSAISLFDNRFADLSFGQEDEYLLPIDAIERASYDPFGVDAFEEDEDLDDLNDLYLLNDFDLDHLDEDYEKATPESIAAWVRERYGDIILHYEEYHDPRMPAQSHHREVRRLNDFECGFKADRKWHNRKRKYAKWWSEDGRRLRRDPPRYSRRDYAKQVLDHLAANDSHLDAILDMDLAA